MKIWNIETAEVKFNYSNEVNGRPSDAKFTKESKKIIIRIVFYVSRALIWAILYDPFSSANSPRKTKLKLVK